MRLKVSLAALALLVCTIAAAKPIESPSRTLRDGRVMLASGTYSALEQGGHVTRIALSGVASLKPAAEVPDALLIRSPDWVAARLTPSDRLIVAFTTFQRDPTLPDRRIVDPAGPLMLVSDGLEPALFRDTPENRRRLFDADGALREATRAEVLDGLSETDPHWQNFYAHELSMRPDLRDGWDSGIRAHVERLIRDIDAHPSARAALLITAARQNASGEKPAWWQSAALEVLRSQPVAVSTSAVDTTANLLRITFDLLEQSSATIDESILLRWTASSSPVLSERALLAVRRIAPEREAPMIAQVLERNLLSATTRDFLIDHLRRLHLMRDALAKRSELPQN